MPFNRRQATREQDTQASFLPFDLELDPMTLVCELDLDISKMYPYTKNELARSRLSKVRALQTDRQTQTDATEDITTPH